MAIRHEIRKWDGTRTVDLTPVKAIRYKCLNCCGYSCKMVAECPDNLCELWPYRFGRNPSRKGQGGQADHIQTPVRGRSISQDQFCRAKA